MSGNSLTYIWIYRLSVFICVIQVAECLIKFKLVRVTLVDMLLKWHFEVSGSLLCEKCVHCVFFMSAGPRIIQENKHDGDQFLLKNFSVKVRWKSVHVCNSKQCTSLVTWSACYGSLRFCRNASTFTTRNRRSIFRFTTVHNVLAFCWICFVQILDVYSSYCEGQLNYRHFNWKLCECDRERERGKTFLHIASPRLSFL